MATVFGLNLTSKIEQNSARFDDLEKKHDRCRSAVDGRYLMNARI